MKEYQHATMISVCVRVLMSSFKYFEKIPILGKCLLYFVPSENISKFLCPMSSWSWRSWQFPVYWSLTLKQLHLLFVKNCANIFIKNCANIFFKNIFVKINQICFVKIYPKNVSNIFVKNCANIFVKNCANIFVKN